MSCILTFPSLGNMKLYDVSARVDMHSLRSDYADLTVDPYVPEGFRYKHIVRYRYEAPSTFSKLPNGPLYQSSAINPTHGNIQREYPEYVPSDVNAFDKVLRVFQELANVPDGEGILIQAQRITCNPAEEGLPSVEGWHRDGVTKIGILCVDKNNVKGGINLFKRQDDPSNIVEICMDPGQMVVFEDAPVQHRVTPINTHGKTCDGYRDVMLFAYPDCSM